MATGLENDSAPGCLTGDLRSPVTCFKPSMWGDIFTTFSFNDQVQEKYAENIETLKEEVRSMLMAATSCKLIILIDTLERLGLAYHFEMEIKEKLEQIYDFGHDGDQECDLFTTALRFRLLRQHRHNVSCRVFDKFKDEDNKFHETLSNDAERLVSLYEAAHVRIHGEDILEEAIAFATHHLTRMLPHLKSPLKDKVKRALKQPLHMGVPIIEIRLYISFFERDDSKDELLLKLAKLNFNYLQNLYKKELCELSRWWNKSDLMSKLPYSRDRVIECYLWGVAFNFEPQYSVSRMAVAKTMQMVISMDDTYDNYATLEEAQLFTDILERWDIDEINRLPEYMKTLYQFILSIYEDYERDAANEGKTFAVRFYRETVKQLGRAYNQEIKWLRKRYIPSFEEYSTNLVITSCAYVMLTALVPGMKSITKQTIDWLLGEPAIVIPIPKMGQHLNNLDSNNACDDKGGKMLEDVDRDMKHKPHGLSKQETLSKLDELREDGWKDLNTEWVANTSMPKEMVVQLLNYTRATELTYKNNEDGFTNPEKNFAPHIIALFVDPIVV